MAADAEPAFRAFINEEEVLLYAQLAEGMLAECGDRMGEEIGAKWAEDSYALDLLARFLVSNETEDIGSWRLLSSLLLGV